MAEGFLPVCREDMEERGIHQMDFVYVSGDAYVDHSSFGTALIARVLESRGYTVGLICQPDWRDPDSIGIYGMPRLAFLVSSGNMDSMVNHYTVAGRRRKQDAYSPGGVTGRRPDRAVIVYCNLIRKRYPHAPIVIGGIEASLRRLGHYDYWSDRVKRSVLLDSGADLVSYGMGEHSIVEIADALAAGISIRDLTYIDGTVCKMHSESDIYDAIRLPDFQEIAASRERYAESFRIQYENTDPFSGRRLYECYGGSMFVVQNPPAKPLSTMEMDDVYALPFMRRWHPMYDGAGGVPAFSEIRYSLTSNRGCFGECNFCALTFHEGRIVQSRSHESILAEARAFTEEKDFKGYIHDVGGPTAQFRGPACAKQMEKGACPKKRCLWPKPCPNMKAGHSDYLALLRKLRKLPGVKKVFIRSGIRFDYLLADKDRTFFRELCRHHISGQLRVAPEHVSPEVLRLMGKPDIRVYNRFLEEFREINQKLGLEQYAVPYLISSHPGSTLADAIALAEYLCRNRLSPEQVQDFYPTPGTVSTCMYYTGLHPLTGEAVYVAQDPHEKAMQRALIQFRKPEHYALVKEALLKEHREDLIGFGPEYLIPPRPPKEGGLGGRRSQRQAPGQGGGGRTPRQAPGQGGGGRTPRQASGQGGGGRTPRQASGQGGGKRSPVHGPGRANPKQNKKRQP